MLVLLAALSLPLSRGLRFAPSLSVARDLGRCDHDYPRWGRHITESTDATSTLRGPPASIIGSELSAYWLRPFALPLCLASPHPDRLSPPSWRAVSCACTIEWACACLSFAAPLRRLTQAASALHVLYAYAAVAPV